MTGRRQLLRDEHGMAISVWMALIVPAVLLMLGIAVDLSGHIGAKRHAYEVAAQAARVAGQKLDADSYLADGRTLRLNPTRAGNAALAYVAGSGMTGSVRAVSATRLVVSTTATYRPQFLSMLGVGTLTVTGEATIDSVRTLEGQERR